MIYIHWMYVSLCRKNCLSSYASLFLHNNQYAISHRLLLFSPRIQVSSACSCNNGSTFTIKSIATLTRIIYIVNPIISMIYVKICIFWIICAYSLVTKPQDPRNSIWLILTNSITQMRRKSEDSAWDPRNKIYET